MSKFQEGHDMCRCRKKVGMSLSKFPFGHSVDHCSCMVMGGFPSGHTVLINMHVQLCAKVMRANFNEFRALFSSKYRRTFDRYFAAFVRQLNKISTTIRQSKRKIESKNHKANQKIASSNFRTSEISKKIRFKSNVISANFPTAR